MTFVRLAGCNAPALGLECVSWCDTPGSWDPAAGRPMDLGEILEQAHFPRLCLTGGEPLLQLEGVAELVEAAERRLLARTPRDQWDHRSAAGPVRRRGSGLGHGEPQASRLRHRRRAGRASWTS